MKNVIVTGANGFLGKNLIRKLSENGFFIYAIVRSVDDTLSDMSNVNSIVIGNKNIMTALELIDTEMIDIVFHFAWEGGNGHLRSDYNVQIKNIELTCDVINFAKKLNCKRFVFPESIMQYEILNAISCDNNLSLNTLYSVSKLSANYMAKILCQNNMIEYIGVLISNIYGPGEKSERLIYQTIRKLLLNEYCRFSSGEQMYDFIYIDDAIEMIYLSSIYGNNNNSYYIGNMSQRKLKEYLNELRNVVNKNATLGFGELPNPMTVVDFTEIDTKKVYVDFGFKCKTDFSNGIQKTLQYIKGEFNEF